MTARVPRNRRNIAYRVFGLLAAVAIAAGADSARAQSGFYAGKTVRIVVASSPGGGYDTYARAIAPFLAEHLPGKPTVVVQNMPGGGGLTAVLFLDASAPKDGTVITLFNAGAITDMASNPDKAKVDLTKMPGSEAPRARSARATSGTAPASRVGKLSTANGPSRWAPLALRARPTTTLRF